MTLTHDPEFRVALARTDEDLRAAQGLRYDVFVEELGGGGPLVDHDERLEKDRFDPFFDHLILFDDAAGVRVAGVYRMLTGEKAKEAGSFYSEDEYDLASLKATGRRLLELDDPVCTSIIAADARCFTFGMVWPNMSRTTTSKSCLGSHRSMAQMSTHWPPLCRCCTTATLRQSRCG